MVPPSFNSHCAPQIHSRYLVDPSEQMRVGIQGNKWKLKCYSEVLENVLVNVILVFYFVCEHLGTSCR